MKVPRRHVVSVLGTDPCVSLPIVGSIEDERLSSSSRATTNVDRFEGRAVSGEPSVSPPGVDSVVELFKCFLS